MEYVHAREALFIHALIIDTYGGRHGVHDSGLFASALERPKAAFGGNDMFAGPFLKAAAYLEAFAQYHTFTDGNKRTAFAIAVRFLEKNGWHVNADQKESTRFVLRVIEDRLSPEAIAIWLEQRATIRT